MVKQIVFDHLLEAKTKYPKLTELTDAGKFYRVNGSIDVVDDEGGCWDTYDVAILIPLNYPDSLPLLIETSHKIKRDSNWHINKEGECCLSTNAKMYYDLKGKITLLNWLDKFAHPYLANHVYKIKTGSYANEEFSHGDAGVFEGWKKIFQTEDRNQILLYLKQMIGVKRLALNRLCFCGSGKKYKRCYLSNPEVHLLNIPAAQIVNDIKAITGINM